METAVQQRTLLDVVVQEIILRDICIAWRTLCSSSAGLRRPAESLTQAKTSISCLAHPSQCPLQLIALQDLGQLRCQRGLQGMADLPTFGGPEAAELGVATKV